MRHETGQVLLQPGRELSLARLEGWKCCCLWVKLTVQATAGSSFAYFRAARQTGTSRDTAARGTAVATPGGLTAQVLTLRDYAETYDLLARLAPAAADPVLVEWVAYELDAPPIVAATSGGTFLPVASPGGAVLPRSDLWGRQLMAEAPTSAAFAITHAAGAGAYNQAFVTYADIRTAIGLPTGDAVAGLIAITDIPGNQGLGELVTLTKSAGDGPTHASLPIAVNGGPFAGIRTPLYYRYDSAASYVPRVIGTTGNAWSLTLSGYFLPDVAFTES